MDKGNIEAMVTKFSEKFAIIMLKKLRTFCRRGLTNLDATPTFQKSSKYIQDALYTPQFFGHNNSVLAIVSIKEIFLERIV